MVTSTTELRGFVRETVGDVYRYALALTVSPPRAEQLTTSATLRLARHVDAVGAAPVSTARLTLVVRREVLDSLPRRHRRDGRRHGAAAAAADELYSGSSALAALATLDADERVALVLRHYDGLLLPDVAAALGVSYPAAETILNRARARLAGTIEQFDDGTGADRFGRLVRAVPGPPDALADRVWVAVDTALVPEYADGGGRDTWSDAWAGRDDPLGWEGFDAVPVEAPHAPPVREARRVGTTLLVGAGALGVVLAVASLTAPRGDSGTGASDSSAETPVTASAPPPAAASPTTVAAFPVVPVAAPGSDPAVTDVTELARSARPPAQPDLQIALEGVAPHAPDAVAPLTRSSLTPPAATHDVDIAVTVRTRDGASRIVIRRVNVDGSSDVWLITVDGHVREATSDAPDQLQAWEVDDGGVVVSLRVIGHPDALVLAGLRAGGGGTWLRLPDGAEPLVAQPDGSVLCVEPGPDGLGLTTYQVLG